MSHNSIEDNEDCMVVLRNQNKILEEQNELLGQILGFIKPVAAFFSAMKVVVTFAAGILAAFVAAYTAWEWLRDYIRHH